MKSNQVQRIDWMWLSPGETLDQR